MTDSFLGKGWSFPPSFEKGTKDVVMSSEEKDIEESLHILLSTSPGERLMQPKFGCPLKQMTFEVIDETVFTKIRAVISDAILFFEARISLNKIEFDKSHVNHGVLKINIIYKIRSTNSRANIVYPFYLTEGNNIHQHG